jgi:hypothetical protein
LVRSPWSGLLAFSDVRHARPCRVHSPATPGTEANAPLPFERSQRSDTHQYEVAQSLEQPLRHLRK